MLKIGPESDEPLDMETSGVSGVGYRGATVAHLKPSMSVSTGSEATPIASAASGSTRVESRTEGTGGAEFDTELSSAEQREVQDLKRRDAEVRTHEQAHLAAAGSLPTAGPFYDFETGPDGRRYAVGGEVKISAPEGQTPDETIRIQEQLIRAALAPAEPSTQDRRVAAAARAEIQQAKAEKASESSKLSVEPTKPTARESSTSSSPINLAYVKRALGAYSSISSIAA